MIRRLHNKKIPQYFLAIAGLVIVAYYALNSYPVGEWFGKFFLDFRSGPQILGVVTAAFIGMCVFLLFFHKEYMKISVKAYSKKSGDTSFENAFGWFTFFVLLLEFCSVGFRWIQLNGNKLGWVLLGIGIVGMALTYILGKILHAQVNEPPSVAARNLREEAGRQAFNQGRDHLDDLSIEEKRRIANFDNSPLDEVRDVKARERENEVKAVEERRKVEEEEARKDEEMYQRMISPTSTSTASSNGHSKPF